MMFKVDGALRDAYVFHATEADWQKVVDLVRSRGWRYVYSEDGSTVGMPTSVAEIFGARSVGTALLAFWPSMGLQINTHFFDQDMIEFDLDPSEVQDQTGLDGLVEFLRAIGRELKREVVVTWENMPDAVILTFDPGSDRVSAIAH